MSQVSEERLVDVGGLTLNVQEFGDAEQPALVLIMGLGMQMISWPDPLCAGLAERGYRVIRFDNRDSGLSQKFEHQRAPGPLKLLISRKLGLSVKVPYQLRDMASDVVNLLDVLQIGAAHVVGASMGGMIGQLVAALYPERVTSLTSIMSTSGARQLPQPRAEVLKVLMTPAARSEEDYLRNAMRTWSLIGSPAYPPNDEALRARLLAGYRRSYCPGGTARQLAAIAACGSRVNELKRIIAPTLVIHGRDDALVPVEGGEDTARHIPGARLEVIDGMGHDLPEPLLSDFVEMIAGHAGAAVAN
ncbi:alpha/beta fold hydrolase [Litorivivens sp.]|uniref:alpha/beta fold hydrolase n=1 Tax=Litorivivens sp. TaxID=2020868 RepID=UPI003563FDB1